MTMELNEPSVTAATAAIEAHSNAIGIEGSASIQLQQLLVSLHEYCLANDLCFDTELQEVRETLASGELGLPESESYVKKQAVAALSGLRR